MPATNINFIPQNAKQAPSTGQRLFRLAITRGKNIIVITEAIVLLVFLSRFKLDTQIQDYELDIENKNAIIQSTRTIETKYRNAQKRVKNTKQAISAQTNWPKQFALLNTKIPQGITLTTARYLPTNININATATSTESFGALIYNLLNDKQITSVILESSSYNKGTNQFIFALLIATKPSHE